MVYYELEQITCKICDFFSTTPRTVVCEGLFVSHTTDESLGMFYVP